MNIEMNRKKEKVSVVGGAGFIGSNLADALVGLGFDVHVVDNLSAGKREHVHKDAVLHVVDVRNYDDLVRALAGSSYVFHLAALPRVQYSIEHPRETHDVNVTGVLNSLLAAREANAKRFVYAASSSAYGNQETLPLHEDLPPQPISPYGLQKYEGELLCTLFSTVYGLPTVSLRYFNVYGPRLDPEGAYALVIGKFLKQRKEGSPLTVTGDGTQTRDFTHVRDIVRANILAMTSEKVGKGEVINVGGGKNRSVLEVARLVGGGIEFIPPRLEPKHSSADNRRARELLGWEPTISLEEGIEELKGLFGLPQA